MQLCNLTLRHGGSLLHTVPVQGATPAEILILKKIHGADAVVDVRPTKFDKRIRNDDEWDRLAHKYDRQSAFTSSPGEDSVSLMATLFPGAMRKLPATLDEIGMGHLAAAARKAKPSLVNPVSNDTPDLPVVQSPAAPREDDDEGDDDDGIPAEVLGAQGA